MQLKHSGLGIASFIVSIFSGGLMFITVVIAGLIEASSPDGMDETSPVAMMVGFAIFGFVGISLIALVLGIVGLFQSDRKKIFALLGTIFSALTILGIAALILIGITMG